MNPWLFSNTVVPSDERLREYEADFTPAGVVRQCLHQLAQDFELGGPEVFAPKTYLDPSAGFGAWPRIVRELWPNCHITAVEIREEERANLQAVADVVRIEGFCAFEEGLAPTGGFDLIATNPPFSFTRDWVREIVESKILRPATSANDDGGVLCLLEKTDAFQRSQEGVTLIRAITPFLEYRIGQSLRFRGKKGETGDQRSYSHFIWTARHSQAARTSWTTKQLKLLDSADRKHS